MELELFAKVVNQKPADRNKIYSLRESEVNCVGKSEERRKHEYGTKASIAQTLASILIVDAMNVRNEYEGKTLKDVFFTDRDSCRRAPKAAYCYRVTVAKRKLRA